MTDKEHFKGCHPTDHSAPETPGHEPQNTELCWHCATPTSLGCSCGECWEQADYVPPESVYHCPTCGRWWAYMMPRITTIRFNAPAE